MPDTVSTGLRRTSPLARYWQGADAARMSAGAVSVEELPFQGVIRLQRREATPAFMNLVADILGAEAPVDPNTCAGESPACLWAAPNEWLLVTSPDKDQALAIALQQRLDEALPGETVAVTLLSDAHAVLKISGAAARDLLAKGCSLDLGPGQFSYGKCAATLLEQVPVTLYPMANESAYCLMVDRSYAAFIWDWLAHAMREFGEAAKSPDGVSS